MACENHIRAMSCSQCTTGCVIPSQSRTQWQEGQIQTQVQRTHGRVKIFNVPSVLAHPSYYGLTARNLNVTAHSLAYSPFLGPKLVHAPRENLHAKSDSIWALSRHSNVRLYTSEHPTSL